MYYCCSKLVHHSFVFSFSLTLRNFCLCKDFYQSPQDQFRRNQGVRGEEGVEEVEEGEEVGVAEEDLVVEATGDHLEEAEVLGVLEEVVVDETILEEEDAIVMEVVVEETVLEEVDATVMEEEEVVVEIDGRINKNISFNCLYVIVIQQVFNFCYTYSVDCIKKCTKVHIFKAVFYLESVFH